jgi:hypothetical protein
MSKFLLSDRDFESVKSRVGNTKTTLEINKIGKDEYAIFEHIGDSVFERDTFTKEEMKTIWQMLTTEK